jgi:RNA polymerase sigma-70 factor (ECF subfamily)
MQPDRAAGRDSLQGGQARTAGPVGGDVVRHDGEAASFDAFYSQTVRRTTHTLYAMTGDLAEAQDAVQEAYARAWQRWSELQRYGDPEAWVRTVARRCAVSRWRKARNAMTATLRAGPPPAAPEPAVDHVLVVEALRRLPEAQRHALVLHHLVGIPVDDVARELGVPVGTVKARLSRGRTALAALIGPVDLEVSP